MKHFFTNQWLRLRLFFQKERPILNEAGEPKEPRAKAVLSRLDIFVEELICLRSLSEITGWHMGDGGYKFALTIGSLLVTLIVIFIKRK